MKLRMFSVVLLFTLLIITVSGNATLQSPEMVDTKSIAGYASNEYITAYGWGEGIGAITESNDYTETWFDDATVWRVGDDLAIYMIMMVQLPDVSDFDNLVFHADWRFLSDVSDTCYWSLGNSTGDIVGAHNNLYSVTTTDTGYEEREISLAIDADVITAQNSTGYLSFIITAAGANDYDIYCDRAFLSLEPDYDFSQTVDGDTYLTPDPTQFLAVYGWGEGVGAITESNSYNETWSNDATVWRVGDDLAIYMIMMVQLPDVSKFDNIVFHADWRFMSDVSDTCYWTLGDYNGDIVAAHNNLYSVTTTDTGYEEVEISLAIDADVITAQNSTGFLSFIITAAGLNDYDIYCDFAFVSLERDYVESFSDVGDWSYWTSGGDPSDDIVTDGDVASIDLTLDDPVANEYSIVTNDITDFDFDSWSSYYIEIRYKISDGSEIKGVLALYDDDSQEYIIGDTSSLTAESWTTVKQPLAEFKGDPDYSAGDDIVSLKLKVDDIGTTNGNYIFYLDYYRISPPDEMGFSHDGSTTDGTTNSASCTVTSDGNELNFTATANIENMDVHIDTTTTSANLDVDYYPFVEYRITGVADGGSDGNVWALNIYDSDGDYIPSGYSDSTGIFRVNVKADSNMDDIDYLRFYLQDTGDSATLDYIFVYGIANYSLTLVSTGSDDYLYVSGGILYSNMDSGEIVLDYDPTFLLNGSYSWNKSTSLGDSYLSFYHGGWKAYSGATTGNLIGGTTTDYRIMFNDTANIIDIQYTAIPPQWHSFTCEDIEVDMPNWHNFTAEEIIVFVIIGQVTVQYWLMLLGFILIPASTIFLVKGGRDEMSINKFLIFLLTFFIGWGLLLGGIYG